MTVDLCDVGLADLRAVLDAIQRGALSCPVNKAELAADGFAPVVDDLLSVLGGLDRRAAERVLGVAIGERTRRPVPRLDLVWTGPEASMATARDTGIVLRELFEAANESVFMAGYSFYDGAELLEPLHRAMVERHVRVRLVLNINRGKDSPDDPTAAANQSIDNFVAKQWTFGEPIPEIWFDPRTAVRQPVYDAASMHAKCVVVDERVTLIGSANFTGRAMDRNIEAGVKIEDARFASGVIEQWNGLISTGRLQRR